MVEDLLTWKLNKARLLLSQEEPDPAEAYMLLQGLCAQASSRDPLFCVQFFSTLSAAAQQLGWYNTSFEWLEISLSFVQREKANLKKLIRQAERAGLEIR